jgi:hypothetical protein
LNVCEGVDAFYGNLVARHKENGEKIVSDRHLRSVPVVVSAKGFTT